MPNFKVKDRQDKIALVAPGWSLTAEQCQLVRDHKIYTIAIGNAFKLMPDAAILYHADTRWWAHYKPEVGSHKVSMAVAKVTHNGKPTLDTAEHLGIDYLLNSKKREGFDLEAGVVVQQTSSGYQALNLAVHHDPDIIYLLGFDMCREPVKQVSHFDGDHPKEVYSRTPFESFIKSMESSIPHLSELGIAVYNCNQNSALQKFPKGDLEECLRRG